MKRIKGYFFTGLALLLPAVVTLWILLFFVNFLTKPFISGVEAILAHSGPLNKPFLFFNEQQVISIISKILIVATLVLVTAFVGFLGKMVAAHYLIRFGDFVIHRIPIVNRIYKAAQDVVKNLFSENGSTFSQVVLVPFPHGKSYSLGLVTSQSMTHKGKDSEKDMVSVFIPATPNPTMGFLLMVSREKMIPIDMTVDVALKSIISCGVMIPAIKVTSGEKKSHEQNAGP